MTVSTIDEGMEVVTGVPAGTPQEDGGYPEGTVHYLVEQHLRELAQKAREHAKGPAEEAEEGEEKKTSDA